MKVYRARPVARPLLAAWQAASPWLQAEDMVPDWASDTRSKRERFARKRLAGDVGRLYVLAGGRLVLLTLGGMRLAALDDNTHAHMTDIRALLGGVLGGVPAYVKVEGWPTHAHALLPLSAASEVRSRAAAAGLHTHAEIVRKPFGMVGYLGKPHDARAGRPKRVQQGAMTPDDWASWLEGKKDAAEHGLSVRRALRSRGVRSVPRHGWAANIPGTLTAAHLAAFLDDLDVMTSAERGVALRLLPLLPLAVRAAHDERARLRDRVATRAARLLTPAAIRAALDGRTSTKNTYRTGRNARDATSALTGLQSAITTDTRETRRRGLYGRPDAMAGRSTGGERT